MLVSGYLSYGHRPYAQITKIGKQKRHGTNKGVQTKIPGTKNPCSIGDEKEGEEFGGYPGNEDKACIFYQPATNAQWATSIIWLICVIPWWWEICDRHMHIDVKIVTLRWCNYNLCLLKRSLPR